MILEMLEIAISEETDAETAHRAVKKIQAHLGGARVYIPKDHDTRNVEIQKAYQNGRSQEEICLAHDISQSTLWRIVRSPIK